MTKGFFRSIAVVLTMVFAGPAIARPIDNAPAIAMALSAQPMTASHLALGGRLAKALHQDAQATVLIDEDFAKLQADKVEALKRVPPESRAKMNAAMEEALAVQKRDSIRAMQTGLARYYAASFAPADLTLLVPYFEAPGFQDAIGHPERAEKHVDELSKLLPPSELFYAMFDVKLGSAQVVNAILVREEASRERLVGIELCRRLKAHGLNYAQCAGA